MSIRNIFTWKNFIRAGWIVVGFNVLLMILGYFSSSGDGRQYYSLGLLFSGFAIATILFVMGVLWALNLLTERWKLINNALLVLSWVLVLASAIFYIISIAISIFQVVGIL